MGKILKFKNSDQSVSEETVKVRERFNKSVPATTTREASARRSSFRVIKGGKKD